MSNSKDGENKCTPHVLVCFTFQLIFYNVIENLKQTGFQVNKIDFENQNDQFLGFSPKSVPN